HFAKQIELAVIRLRELAQDHTCGAIEGSGRQEVSNAGDTTRRISFGKLVGLERSISRPVSWKSCDRRKIRTRSVASWYLRSLMHAFSIFSPAGQRGSRDGSMLA